jgi:hypothetical protein
MRWEDLFADLERQWEALAEGDRRVEIAERTRAELAQVGLAERLRGAEGRLVRVRTREAQEVEGEVCCVGADFLLLTTARQESVLPLTAITAATGLGDASVSAEVMGRVRAGLGLGWALRRIAADRSPVSLVVAGGAVLTGTVQRVGADFLEMAVHGPDETPRARRSRGLTLVPFGAIAVLRRDAPA